MIDKYQLDYVEENVSPFTTTPIVFFFFFNFQLEWPVKTPAKYYT